MLRKEGQWKRANHFHHALPPSNPSMRSMFLTAIICMIKNFTNGRKWRQTLIFKLRLLHLINGLNYIKASNYHPLCNNRKWFQMATRKILFVKNYLTIRMPTHSNSLVLQMRTRCLFLYSSGFIMLATKTIQTVTHSLIRADLSTN